MPTSARGLLAAFAFFAAACSSSHEPEIDFTGAWLSRDGTMLIAISDDRRVEIHAVQGEGSCLLIGLGSIDRSEIVARDGTRYPISLVDGALVVDDPTDGFLTGRYEAASFTEVCSLELPPPGENGARASELPVGPLDVSGDRGRREIELELAEGAVSFAIYVFGDEVGTRVGPSALFDPSGQNLLGEVPDIGFCVRGFCAVMIPRNGAIAAEPGAYRLRMSGPANAMADLIARGVVRPGPLPPVTSLPLRPIVATENASVAEVEAAVSRVRAIYEAESVIGVDVLPTIVADPALSRVPADFAHPSVVDLISMGDADSLNLIFVDRVTGIPGLLGIAAGIPATLGLKGPWNGVLVALDAHRFIEPPLDTDFVGDTAAHEAGHALGLFHTTEEHGLLHDPIADTPECRPERDLNGDGVLTVDECEDLDGFNMMFWTPMYGDDALAVQHEISAEQSLVIEHVVVGEAP